MKQGRRRFMWTLIEATRRRKAKWTLIVLCGRSRISYTLKTSGTNVIIVFKEK
jgi:hypothetical protein